jgi:hypothetical protein
MAMEYGERCAPDLVSGYVKCWIKCVSTHNMVRLIRSQMEQEEAAFRPSRSVEAVAGTCHSQSMYPFIWTVKQSCQPSECHSRKIYDLHQV